MAKDYAEMLRKAREGYAAATSGTTSGASQNGAKDYAKMLQDARNRVQGIQSNNDADAAQRASMSVQWQHGTIPTTYSIPER